MKETSFCCRAARNLVKRGESRGAEISLMKNNTLKSMRGCSRYNKITKLFVE